MALDKDGNEIPETPLTTTESTFEKPSPDALAITPDNSAALKDSANAGATGQPPPVAPLKWEAQKPIELQDGRSKSLPDTASNDMPYDANRRSVSQFFHDIFRPSGDPSPSYKEILAGTASSKQMSAADRSGMLASSPVTKSNKTAVDDTPKIQNPVTKPELSPSEKATADATARQKAISEIAAKINDPVSGVKFGKALSEGRLNEILAGNKTDASKDEILHEVNLQRQAARDSKKFGFDGPDAIKQTAALTTRLGVQGITPLGFLSIKSDIERSGPAEVANFKQIMDQANKDGNYDNVVGALKLQELKTIAASRTSNYGLRDDGKGGVKPSEKSMETPIFQKLQSLISQGQLNYSDLVRGADGKSRSLFSDDGPLKQKLNLNTYDSIVKQKLAQYDEEIKTAELAGKKDDMLANQLRRREFENIANLSAGFQKAGDQNLMQYYSDRTKEIAKLSDEELQTKAVKTGQGKSATFETPEQVRSRLLRETLDEAAKKNITQKRLSDYQVLQSHKSAGAL